jgi:hypothetical protein
MGVRKFRSAADVPAPPPLPRLDAENLRMACELSSLERLRPVRRAPGVRKFRSIDEMSRAQERWEEDGTTKHPPPDSIRRGSARSARGGRGGRRL